MSQFEEKTISKQHIFQGKIISLEVDDVELPDGIKAKREIIKHPGAVAILAITEDKKIVFVKQYRKPIEQPLIEIPAGKIEPNEAPEITARRELEEETGFTTENLQYLTSFYTSPGFANEIIHLYFTDNLLKLNESVPGDEDENIELMYLTLGEIKGLFQSNQANDAKTMLAIQQLELMGLVSK